MAYNVYPTLNDVDAIALWKQGKNAWNKWVKDNPNYNIDFSDVDFPREVPEWDEISFSGFRFPCGEVSFEGANFGTNDVTFASAEFGVGKINFRNATFESGEVDFRFANFGEGEVLFSGVNFGTGDIIFLGAIFGKGDVLFINTIFLGRNLYFVQVDLDKGKVSFSGAKITGRAVFMLENLKDLSSLLFKYATFDGPLDISSKEMFPCLIDLTHTKTSHHVSLHGLNCTLPRKSKRRSRFFPNSSWMTHKVATDPEDEDRARRLKELAEANKDYEKAKEFHIMELQAKREFNSPFGFLLTTEFWYEKLSDYGRDMSKPLWWMAFVWWVWSIIYLGISAQITEKFQLIQSFVYSASQMLSFIPSSRNARTDIGDTLFGENMPEWIYLLTFSQSLVSLILLFLFGLALRYKYRI